MPWCARKYVPKAIFSGVDISKSPGCQLFRQTSSQLGSQKLLQVLMSHELTVCLSVFKLLLTHRTMAILSKGCKPGKNKT